MLRVENLVKSFGSNAAVADVSFEVLPGQVFGLLGPNGAGKTTITRMCVGLLAPDSGRIRIGKEELDVSARRARRLVGVAPQDISLYEELTAAENLALFGRLYGMTASEARQRAKDVLGQVGLAERAGERVKTFSGGMKRRLNFAAAVLYDPLVVLLDEPTAGVDPQSRAGILDMVQALKASGKAVLYTTHYMEEAQKLCDVVGILDHGKLLALDSVEELIKAHAGPSVVVMSRGSTEERIPTTNALEDLTRLLSSGAANDVSGIRIERPDLESVFLSLTGRGLRD